MYILLKYFFCQKEICDSPHLEPYFCILNMYISNAYFMNVITHNTFFFHFSFTEFYIRSTGTSGHGSMLFDNTAAEKLMFVVNKILDWRTTEKQKLSQGMELGEITSVNMTILKGGNHLNVVPQELFAGFDVRLAPDADHQGLEDTIVRWCHEAGNGVKLEVVKKNKQTSPTKLDDSNPWWLKFKSECDKMYVRI